MKILIFILSLFIISEAQAATYNATVLKDIGTNTPQSTENPGTAPDTFREIKRILESQYHILTLTGNGTATTTDTFIIGSSSTGILVTLPAASSVANGTTTKVFVVKNRGAGTLTLSPSVDGVGSPTVSQNQTMSLFTNGTDWFEISANKAFSLSGYIGLGTQTRGTIGLGTQTSGTLSLGTQTSGQLDLGGQTGLISLGTQTNSRLSFGTQTTGKIELGTQTNGSLSLGTQTNGQLDFGGQTGLVSLGTQTNSKLSLGTQSAGLLSLGTQTNGLLSIGTQSTGLLSLGTQTNGLLSIGTQTNGQLDFGGQTGLISLGTQATSRLSLGTQTAGTIGLATQTTGLLSLATQTTGNYLQKWTTGSHTAGGTGTVRFAATGDTLVSSTYNDNGNGTITVALSPGVSNKPDAKVDGVVQVSGPTAYDYPGAFFSIAGSSTDAAITFKNPSLGTQSSGLLSIGTQSTGNLPVSRLDGSVSLGTQSTGNLEASRVVNLPWTRSGTAVNLGTVTDSVNIGTTTSSGTLRIIGTTTITGGSVYIGTTTQSNSSVVTIATSATSTSPLSIVGRVVNSDAGTNSTAVMTGTSTPAPNDVRASLVEPTAVAWEAFDRIMDAGGSNRWVANTDTNSWLRYDFGTGNTKTVTQYNIAVRESTYAPKDWTFEGSQDNSTWSILDTRSTITGWTGETYKEFSISSGSQSAYRSFRINITASQGSGYTDIEEMQLISATVLTAFDTMYIAGSNTVLIGTTTLTSSSTAYKLQIDGSGLAASWGVTCYEAIKSIVDSGTDTIKRGYDAVMGTKLFTHHPKIRDDITLAYAEAIVKSEYVNNFIKADFETFKTDRLGSYTTYTDGSSTVNWTRFNNDFQEQYVKPREDEFYVLPDMNKRIKDKKVNLESDTSITSITPVSDDPSTPDLFKRHDKKILDLEPQIGCLMSAAQYQDTEIKELKALVGSLTSRINKAGIK